MLPELEILKKNGIVWCLFKGADSISNIIRKNGEFAKLERSIAAIYSLNKEATILDIGANLGAFSVPLARMQGIEMCDIIAFEPQRIVFQQLCTNVMLNRIDNIYCNNWGLGKEEGVIRIPELDMQNSQNVGGFSIEESMRFDRENKPGFISKNYYTGNTHNVEIKCLDGIKIEKPISFIKVDVEGHELEVFQGGEQTLKDHGFPPILFEVWEGIDWYKEKAAETKKCIADLGYQLTRVGENFLAQHEENPSSLVVIVDGDKINFSTRDEQ